MEKSFFRLKKQQRFQIFIDIIYPDLLTGIEKGPSATPRVLTNEHCGKSVWPKSTKEGMPVKSPALIVMASVSVTVTLALKTVWPSASLSQCAEENGS